MCNNEGVGSQEQEQQEPVSATTKGRILGFAMCFNVLHCVAMGFNVLHRMSDICIIPILGFAMHRMSDMIHIFICNGL